MSNEPFFPKGRVTESTSSAVTLDDPDLLPPARLSSCHYQVIATIGMCLSVYSALVLTVCPMWPKSPAFMKILAQQQNCSGIFDSLGQPYSTTIAETTTIALIIFVFLLFFISYWRSSCTNPVRCSCSYISVMLPTSNRSALLVTPGLPMLYFACRVF